MTGEVSSRHRGHGVRAGSVQVPVPALGGEHEQVAFTLLLGRRVDRQRRVQGPRPAEVDLGQRDHRRQRMPTSRLFVMAIPAKLVVPGSSPTTQWVRLSSPSRWAGYLGIGSAVAEARR